MRELDHLNHYRVAHPAYGFDLGDAKNGYFEIEHEGNLFRAIASDGEGWDHVSISLPDRCPTWAEMEYFRERFFEDHETVMQLSVPRADHINRSPTCLHLWRPQNDSIPRPPGWMVG